MMTYKRDENQAKKNAQSVYSVRRTSIIVVIIIIMHMYREQITNTLVVRFNTLSVFCLCDFYSVALFKHSFFLVDMAKALTLSMLVS